jgi:hypothetical protein
MGTLLNRGIASFRKKSKERESQFKQSFVYLRDDGERARIRFLSDADTDFVLGVFHRPFTNSKLSDPILCLNDSDTIPEGIEATECRLCELKDATARLMFFSWVYVYHILHPHQNPRLDEDATAPHWEPVKLGTRTMFKQSVGQVRMLLGGKKMHDSIVGLHEELGGLLETDFSFIRSGARKSSDTTYSFVPAKSATKPDEKVIEAIKALTDLETEALAGTLAYYAVPAAEPGAEEAAPYEEEEVVGASADEDFADI